MYFDTIQKWLDLALLQDQNTRNLLMAYRGETNILETNKVFKLIQLYIPTIKEHYDSSLVLFYSFMTYVESERGQRQLIKSYYGYTDRQPYHYPTMHPVFSTCGPKRMWLAYAQGRTAYLALASIVDKNNSTVFYTQAFSLDPETGYITKQVMGLISDGAYDVNTDGPPIKKEK